jgi:hypothetical protein
MILYHGSNREIDRIDPSKSRPYKELTSQISFHTEAAVRFLTKTEAAHG